MSLIQYHLYDSCESQNFPCAQFFCSNFPLNLFAQEHWILLSSSHQPFSHALKASPEKGENRFRKWIKGDSHKQERVTRWCVWTATDRRSLQCLTSLFSFWIALYQKLTTQFSLEPRRQDGEGHREIIWAMANNTESQGSSPLLPFSFFSSTKLDWDTHAPRRPELPACRCFSWLNSWWDKNPGLPSRELLTHCLPK